MREKSKPLQGWFVQTMAKFNLEVSKQSCSIFSLRLQNMKKDLLIFNRFRLLIIPFQNVNNTKHGLRSFHCLASKTWNALLKTIRTVAGTMDFVNKVSHMKF